MTRDVSRMGARPLDCGVVRYTKRVVLAVVAAAGVFIAGPVPAEAHHANVGIDNVTCTGLVTFTIEAWDGADAPSRSSPRVDVSYRTNGGSFTPLAHPSYALSADKDFRASASFQLAKPLPKTLELMTTPRAIWGDGAQPDQSQLRESTTRSLPTCRQTPVSPPPLYKRFLPWLSVGLLAVVAARLLLNLRRGVSRSTGARARLGYLLFVADGEVWLAVSAALLGTISGVALTVLLVRA